MRFIINFILFGFLFFLIWHFFPEAFHKLVSWVQTVFDWISAAIQQVSDKVAHPPAEPTPTTPPPVQPILPPVSPSP